MLSQVSRAEIGEGWCVLGLGWDGTILHLLVTVPTSRASSLPLHPQGIGGVAWLIHFHHDSQHWRCILEVADTGAEKVTAHRDFLGVQDWLVVEAGRLFTVGAAKGRRGELGALIWL